MDFATLPFSDRPDIRRIDADIAKLRAEIVALLAQRNSLHPMNNLPEEILSEILLMARMGTDQPLNEPRRTATSSIRIVSVCQRWRQVAMNTPKFWSTIAPSEFPSAYGMMKRSGNQPIFIRFPQVLNATRSQLSMVDSIMEHGERFEEVSMNAAGMGPDHLLFATHICKKLFTDTYLLPKLKSFHIYANIASPGPLILLRKALHPLPSLRSLRLHGAVIPLEHPFEAPQLEYLDISLPSPPHEPPTSWLIRLLKGFPVLRTLIVDRLHPRHALELAPKSISIPHLKHLEVSSSTTFHAQKFLDAFDMSLSVVNITLKITVSVMDASAFSRFEDMCIQYFHASHRSTRCLSLNFATSRDSLGRPSSTFNLAVSTDADAPNFLNFILPWTPGTEDRYIRLTQRLSTQLTTNLRITGVGSEQLSSLLPNLFPHFPSVTSLTIANCTDKILSTLSVPAITTATDQDPPLVLPQLTKLSFTKCRLSEPEGAPTAFYSNLLEIVKDRQFRGDPIQDVVITQCDIAMHQVEELGTLVRVSWDGKINIQGAGK